MMSTDFKTRFATTDELLAAIRENNDINDAKWSDFRIAEEAAEIYKVKLDEERLAEFRDALGRAIVHEGLWGTEAANELTLSWR